MPSHMFGSVYRDSKIGQLATTGWSMMLRSLVLQSASRTYDVEIRESISRALNVKHIEMCPSLALSRKVSPIVLTILETSSGRSLFCGGRQKSGYFGIPAV